MLPEILASSATVVTLGSLFPTLNHGMQRVGGSIEHCIRGFTNARNVALPPDPGETHALLTDLGGDLYALHDEVRWISERLLEATERSAPRWNPAYDNLPAFQATQAHLLRAGNVLVRDRPIRIDDSIVHTLLANPDHFMSAIQPADRPLIDPGIIHDRSQIAFLFEKHGRQLIGFAKVGMLQTWGMNFHPLLHSEGRAKRLSAPTRPTVTTTSTGCPLDGPYPCGLAVEMGGPGTHTRYLVEGESL